MQNGQQLPYLLERRPGLSSTVFAMSPSPHPKRPSVSRWKLTLPKPALPIVRMTFTSPTVLFQRQAVLSEEAESERGESYTRLLGDAFWTRTPGQTTNELVLALSSRPTTGELHLEIENGDNPPLQLTSAQAFLPQSRLIFKQPASGDLFLYYGEAQAQAPRYDLVLVGETLRSAQRITAILGAEEVLKHDLWSDLGGPPSRGPKLIFWAVLLAVIAGLLLVITRLLPAAPKSDMGQR